MKKRLSLKNGLKNIKSKLELSDVVFLIGGISLFYGVYRIYQPAAFIVLGAGLIYGALPKNKQQR